MKKLLLPLLVLSIFACNQAIPETNVSENNTKAEVIIRENIAAFSKALMEQNYDVVVNAYTQDGKIFPGRRPILEGYELIRDYWVPKEGNNSRISYHKIIPEEIKILGKEAYDYGYYEGRSIGNDGQESSWKGKYVIVWKEVEGDWKMYLDIWNSVPLSD